MKKAFTLMEVNLAVMIMAFGVLGLVALYSLGYRESSQSKEDVEAAALADKNLNALVTMLSSTNMTWSQWKQIGTRPRNGSDDTSGGWLKYFNADVNDNSQSSGANTDPNSLAEGAFNDIKSRCSGCEGASNLEFDPGNLKCGLVVYQNGPRCGIAFRASRRAGTLIYQPLYYTEVFFQGDTTK